MDEVVRNDTRLQRKGFKIIVSSVAFYKVN